MAVKTETKGIKGNTDSLIFWKSRGGVLLTDLPSRREGWLGLILREAEKDNEVAAAFRPMEWELEESHLFEALRSGLVRLL